MVRRDDRVGRVGRRAAPSLGGFVLEDGRMVDYIREEDEGPNHESGYEVYAVAEHFEGLVERLAHELLASGHLDHQADR